ncbi:MAG: efflux RND transporter permease subunit, partial [Burkholderiales bacterium]|nr:efflux RND transporter permease subunit [Burkholderiales bacterium]
ATGAGAGARRSLGTAVVFGMLLATMLGIYFIPSFYVWLQRLAERRSPFREERGEPPSGGGTLSASPAGRHEEA